LLYILWGQDDFSLYESLEEIKRSIGDQALLATNTTTFDGQDLTVEQLRAVCETVPFLAEKRLVIVNGLLERFEPKGKSSRQKKNALVTNQQSEYKSLSDCIGKIPDSTILVLIDNSRIGSNNRLLKELSAKAKVKSFPLLRGSKLRQWTQGYVTKEGGSISPRAVDLLAELVGSNLRIMVNEVNKLILFTSGRRIEEEDIKVVTSCAQEANVFALIDAIFEFRVGIAEQLLQQLLQRGASPAYLLVMLSRQAQRIVQVKALRNQRKSEKEIQDKLGLTSEFVWRKILEQANRYPMERLKDIYRKLLETDLSIKTGKYGGELALNLLIAELCQRNR